jgi:hypothetical protein
MKKTVFLIFALFPLLSTFYCQQIIIVTNITGIERKGEMVEVNISDLKSTLFSKPFFLKNRSNHEVDYQLIYNGNIKPQILIFQADVKAKSSTTYTLTVGQPTIVKPKTFARFVPERKDDIAWENDMAAYRMYGPALANENPSNGVDYWAKCTNNLVVDQRYKDDVYNKISYHVDHGLGLDFYKVGHTLGCGGVAPYVNGKLCVGSHFSRYKIIEVGPLRSIFSLEYDSVEVGNSIYREELTITTTAGSLLNKGTVRFIGAYQKMELAAGIYLHDVPGVLKQNVVNGTSGYAEVATSDAKVPAGRDYIGVFIPAKVNKAFTEGEHALVTSSYRPGDSFTYYFGAGWSKWHYPTDNDWFAALNQFRETTCSPLKVTINN